MGRAKIAITLRESSLRRLDKLVRERLFPNRIRAIQEAVEEKLARIGHGRLAKECANLDAEPGSWERAGGH